MRGGGKGGQAVAKTSNAVILIHKPTGTIVRCHKTRSQQSNRLIARKELQDSHAVTLSLSGDFLEPVYEGALVEARGEVVRGGGKTIIVAGLVTADGKPSFRFNGIIRKVRRG